MLNVYEGPVPLFQVADEMAHRMLDLDTKVRTPDCEILERQFRDNLSDLRVLAAKEYCVMLIGQCSMI